MKTLTPLLTAGALAGAAALAARRAPDDLRGEVAVVTGASRGLGLLLAGELARQGCRLVICARDAAELDRAAAQLREAGADVTAVACDVTDEAAPSRLVETALERYGRLDIVLSNAGIIQVGPVQQASAELFEIALDTMALAPARLALEALPVMRRQQHGRIVTIASIGGKLSVPHLLPYSTAKFAAVGFSEGLRAELGRGPVAVTTVVPGLMRTGSHMQARFTGQAEKEFTWFALGASLPLLSMDAERAARQIIGAVRERRAEVILTPAGQVVSRIAGLAPGLTSEVLHLVQRLALPAPAGRGPGADGEGRPGRDLEPSFSRAVFDRLTALGRSAAERFNELRLCPGPTVEGCERRVSGRAGLGLARLDRGGRGSSSRLLPRRGHGGSVMANVGYTLMTEQAGPKDLVRWAARAEEAGFDLLVSSDHYFPWVDEQGHAPNAWVMLGAVAQVTERAELMTYVTCPTMRYHPAVVAQQAATLALLSGDRFTLGLGAGENLNEHVIGGGWPGADQRQEMLAEAVCIIRDLLDGGYVNFKGTHFRVDSARIWDLPDRSVPLGVAVSGQQSCELFAPLADVMIAVEPDGSLAGWWDAASGTGRPARKIGQMPICWGPDRDECIRRAHEQFRWFGGGWKVNAELPGTAGFAGATSFVRPEDVAGSIPCGDSVDAVAEAAEAFFKAGFTDLALVQIGGTDPEQARFFAAAPELITALKEAAGS